SVDIDSYGFDPGNHVSTGIHKLSGFSNSTVGGKFVFQCSGPNGAALALPHSAHVEKLENVVSMQCYAEKHAESWYKYARE
ncbi:hypothetical protein B0H14DRAFT_3734684, partial [Mycena olivaceomarginata]